MMRKTKETKMEIQITQAEFDALLRGEISFDIGALQHDKEEAEKLQEARDAKIAEKEKRDRAWKERSDAWVNEHWNDASNKVPYAPIMLNGRLIPEEEWDDVQDGGALIVHESAGSDGNTEVNKIDGDLISWTISFLICIAIILSIPIGMIVFALSNGF
jgi:hypothetical protein